MNRTEQAHRYHEQGFSCCQSVVAAFQDRTGLNLQESMNLAGGLGAGAQAKELCGAVAAAVIVIGLTHPVDLQNPVESKARTGAIVREFHKRFRERFGSLRCAELLESEISATEDTPAAQDLCLNKRCDILTVSAVEILDDMLKEGM